MPYKEAALRYMTHGWAPLPVGNRPGEKTPPPTGWTGTDAPDPNEDQIVEWTRTHPDRNIGVRMPDNVIGIDVDGYDDKPGVFTMKATAERHGKLPATWVSTSRTDLSGIRWFRLPQPGRMPGKLIHPDNEEQSGVEVIQRHHRFAVVPPSIHPTGRTYQWITPDGETSNNPPTPAGLPKLPQPWVDHIRRECSCWSTRFDWNRYKTTSRNPVEDAYQRWSARITAAYGRHDAALGGVMALVAFRDKGWPDAHHYLGRLEQDFYNSLGDSRNQREAQAEWQRMVDGATDKAPTTSIPQWEPHHSVSGPATPEQLDARVAEELDRLRIRDRAQRMFKAEQRPPEDIPPVVTLRQRLAQPLPDVTWRIEGWQPANSRIMLAAQYKAGKTTLTGNLSRSLVDGQPWLGTAHVNPIRGKVSILDFEMSERQIAEWLGDQNIVNDDKIVIAALRGKAGTFDILDDDIRTVWADKLRGTEYLILDCLRPILDAIGLDEHKEGGRFLTAFDALCDQAGITDALVVHHMGHAGERARGDSRFRDWPDVEWRLVRETDDPNSNRYISAFGRDVEQPESQLSFDPATRHLTMIGGNRHEAAARAIIPDILEYIGDDPRVTKSAIETAMSVRHGHTRNTVRDAIEIGLRDFQFAKDVGPKNAHYIKAFQPSSPVRRSSPPPNGELEVSSPVRIRTGELTEQGKQPCCDHPIPGAHRHNCPQAGNQQEATQ